MKEIWKDVSNYEGLYQVSNLGRIKSLERKINRKHSTTMLLKEKILKQQNMNGYKFVRLSKNNIIKQHFVHRLVAIAFIKNPNNYNEVNHKDEKTNNNYVYNLEWCTHKYNMNYGTINQRRSKTETKTKKNGKKIIQYDINNVFIKKWNNQLEIQKQLKIAQPHISNCCKGKRKTAGGYIWKYEKEV
jgi:hypothetical protein